VKHSLRLSHKLKGISNVTYRAFSLSPGWCCAGFVSTVTLLVHVLWDTTPRLRVNQFRRFDRITSNSKQNSEARYTDGQLLMPSAQRTDIDLHVSRAHDYSAWIPQADR
jgi:hypothetical protein